MLNNNNFLKSRSGSYPKDEDNNGKARCFVCKKEQCRNIVKEDDDYLNLYLRYRNCFLKSESKDNLNSHPNTNLQNIINIHSTNNNNLQMPCACDKQVHPLCLLRYCLMNVSFQCGKCRKFFVFNFYKESKDTDFTIYFSTFLFCLVITATYLLSALCFANSFNVSNNVIHYTYILGTFFFIIAVTLTVYSISYFKTLYNSTLTGADLSTISSNSKENNNIDFSSYFNFLANKHKINKLDLFEKKTNNIIFQETLLKEEMKLQRFIIDNNNMIHRSLGGLENENGKDAGYIKVEIEKKFKFGVPGNDTMNEPFKIIGRQLSYNSHNSHKPPIEKGSSIKKRNTGGSHNSISSDNKEEVNNSSMNRKLSNQIHLNMDIIKEEDHLMKDNHSRNPSDQNMLLLNNSKKGSSKFIKRISSDRSFASQHSVNTSEANLLTNEDKELLAKEKMTNLNKLDKGKAQTILPLKEIDIFKNIDFDTGDINKENKYKKKKGKTGVDIKLNKHVLEDNKGEYLNL